MAALGFEKKAVGPCYYSPSKIFLSQETSYLIDL